MIKTNKTKPQKSSSVVQFKMSFFSILIPLGTAINTAWMDSSNFNLMFTISPLYTDEGRVLSVPKRPGRPGLSGGFQMRAGPGLHAFPAGLAAFLGGRAAFLGGRAAFFDRLSLNGIFCSKDTLLPILRKSPKYET